MMDVTRGAGGEIVIRIDGTFDRQAATRLSGWLGEVPLGSPLVVDFSQVREVQDFGLASAAQKLASHGPVQVVGLGRHQERLLRYFGVDVAPRGAEHADEEAVG